MSEVYKKRTYKKIQVDTRKQFFCSLVYMSATLGLATNNLLHDCPPCKFCGLVLINQVNYTEYVYIFYTVATSGYRYFLFDSSFGKRHCFNANDIPANDSVCFLYNTFGHKERLRKTRLPNYGDYVMLSITFLDLKNLT